MRHPRARSKSLPLLLVAFLILDPFLRAAPAHASNFSAPHSMANAVGGGGGGGGVAVNPNTGDATYTIPIAVPPGTAGMQPNLALAYSSGSREGSWAGLGWSVPVSSIKRSLRNGVPSYNTTYDGTGDMFELDGQALVYQNTSGGEAVYQTKRQSFLDVRHNNTTDIWKVTRPDGHRMYFGQSSDSKVGAPSFEWLVTCEEDAIGTPCVTATNGNKITYTYFKDVSNLVVYLQQVEYGLAPKRFIRFELESANRPDQPVSYLAGFPQKLTRRLDHITVQTATGANPAPANIIRRYDLAFTDASGGQSLDSTRSLLRAVTLKGVGAAGGLTTNFTYKQNTTGATGWDSTAIPWTGAATENHAEINGDGLTDTYSNHTFCLNTGAAYTCTHGYSVPTFSGASPLVDFTDSLGNATGTQLVDLNRDGRSDVVSRRQYLTNGEFTFEGKPGWISSGVDPGTGAVAWNNGVSVVADSHLSFAQVSAAAPGTPGSGIFADLDGDGASEIVVRGDTAIWLTTASCTERRRSEYVYWNNGSMSFSLGGFTDTGTPADECTGLGTRRQGAEYSLGGFVPPVTKLVLNPSANTPPVYYASTDERSLIEYADLNGDGLSDVVWTEVIPGSPPLFVRHAYLNGGAGNFSAADDWRPPVDFLYAPGSVPFPNGVRLVDVNGDGQLDVVQARLGATRQTWLGKGSADGTPATAFVLAPAWALPVDLVNAFGSGLGVTPVALVDVNGDSLPDLSFAGSVRLNLGSIPDLLTAVETPYGAKTNITWTTSAAAIDTAKSPFPNSNQYDVGFMPSLKPVVKAVEVDPLTGVWARTEYVYVRGVFDTVEREFLGFEKVTQTVGAAVTVSGNLVFTPEYRAETIFKNDSYAQAGLAAETLVSDAEGAAYYPRRRTTITYGAGTAIRLPIRVLEKRSEQLSANPTIFQRACTQFTYHATTGNPTQIDQLGLVTNDTCTDDPADTIRSTLIAYASATGSAITGAPSRITQRAVAAPSGNVTVLRDTKLYYDGGALGSIGAGLLTRQERLQATNPLADHPTVLAATTFAYDTATGRLLSATNPRANSGEIPAAKGTRYVVYDASYPDFVGQTQSEPFYASQRLTTTTSYDSDTSCAVSMPPLAGMPAVVGDANGFETVACYDVYGRMTARIDFDGTTELARTTVTYDDTKATATTNPSATTTEYLDASNTRTVTAKLDALGRTILTSASGPGGMTIQRSVAYDGLGRVSAASQPGDGAPGTSAAQYFYDGLGREVLRQSPHPTAGLVDWTTAYTIDANRLRVDSIDPEGHENRSFADAFGDVIQVDEMTGTTPTSTTYKYDATGALAEIKDVNGNLSSFFYDSLGRRGSMIDPDTGLWSYTYDANGNLKAQNGPRTPTPPALDPDLLEWAYDFLDRPKTLTRVGVGGSLTTKTWAYDFATKGRGRFEAESEAGEGFFVVVYDGLGRPVTERALAAGKQFDFSTAYNRAGDVLSRTYPTGRTINYSRDNKGFVTGITTGAGGADIYASDVSWHQSMQLAAWTAGNGIVTSYEYNASTMLPSSFNAGGVEDITSYTYKDNYRLAATSGTTASSFSYDARDRLTAATGPYNTGYAQADLHFGYDAIGNLTCMDASEVPSGGTCTNGKLFTYPTANPANPPARPHAPTAISGMSAPTYDAAGNMLTGNSNTYTYDAEGHVASINGATLKATYAGDGKAWKITTGSLSRYRIYDDFEWTTANLARTSVFLDGKVIAITQENFTPITPGGCGQVWPRNTPQPAGGELALLLMYAFAGALALPMVRAIRRNRPRTLRGWASVATSAVFLVGVSVPPQLVADRADAAAPINTKFFHPDRLGSSLVVSDNTGTASATRVVYRPFGALVQNSGSTSAVPERGFTGQRFEASVGVYDYNARWYDPAIARFVQPDPLIQDATNPQQLNPFSYVNGDPSNFIDPSGLEEVGVVETIVITARQTGPTGCIGCGGSIGIGGGGGSGFGFDGLGGFLIDLKFNFYIVGSSRDPNGMVPGGASKGPKVLAKDFKDGKIPDDIVGMLLKGNAKLAYGHKEKISLARVLAYVDVKHATKEAYRAARRRFDMKAGDKLYSWFDGKTVWVPPGRGLTLHALAHEVGHAYGALNDPFYFSIYQGMADVGGYHDAKNPFEIGVQAFARSVVIANAGGN